MRKPRIFVSVLVLVCGIISAAPTTTSAEEAGEVLLTPEEVCADYLSALKTGDFGKVVPFIDPQSMEEFRDVIIEAESAQSASGSKSFLPLFPSVETLEEFEALSAQEVFYEFCQGLSDRSEFVISVLETPDRKIVGTVFEREDLAHVVYRITPTQPLTAKMGMEVATLRLDDGRWYVRASGDAWHLVDTLVGNIQASKR
jgi:hypothetical protein